MKLKLIILSLCLSSLVFANNDPNLGELKTVGKIIHSELPGHSTDVGWDKATKLMESLRIFDTQVGRMMDIFCSGETNKSVLLVGETNDTYRYYFARLAKMATPANCKKLSHSEVSPNKLQGYMYSGTTQRLWRDKIVNTSFDKDVILYFSNLSLLIGIGTHSNQDTGIESDYSEAVLSGKLKSVAFLNKYDYNRLIRSRHAYVLNAFKEKIVINEVKMAQVDAMVREYFNVMAPTAAVPEKVLAYLYKMSQYYQPNVLEPQRTIRLVDNIVRSKGGGDFAVKERDMSFKTANPYASAANIEKIIEFQKAKSIAIHFNYFDTESGYDYLTIYDGNTDQELAKLSGNKGEYTTDFFNTSKLKLVFTSDTGNQRKGFFANKIIANVATSSNTDEVEFSDVRNAIMEVIQIPAWMMNRDYQVVRNLQGLLDGDVVGVKEGKRDFIKQVKIGYVSGRTDEKPAGALMFVGPTGTGKSYIAKKGAEFMGMQLITLDMTQYSTEDSFDRFLDTMSDALTLYPYAFYLFEEVDKANFKVLDRLYFMMDEGIFYDRNQRPLFARGAFIMMTTNAGHDLIVREQNNPNLRKLVNQELQKHYRPSFLNRFDAISIFTPFSNIEFHQLAQIMTAKKVLKMKEFFDWTVTVEDPVIEYMGVNGRSNMYGARPMDRTVENVLSVGISDFQMEYGTLDFGSTIHFAKGTAKHEFIITVGNQSHNYIIDLSNNSGDKRNYTPFLSQFY